MRTHRLEFAIGLTVLGLGCTPTLWAAQIGLQSATATYSQVNSSDPGLWDPVKTIDGRTSGAFTSWAVNRGTGPNHEETIVWETTADLTLDGGTILRFSLHHQDWVPSAGHNLGRFRLSYTTDDRATFADGLASGGDVSAGWIVIHPTGSGSTGGELLTTQADSSILVSGGTNAYPTYAIDSRVIASGITGFRLEAMRDPSLPFGGPGRQPVNGNFHLSEFIVSTVPEPATAVLSLLGGLALAGTLRRATSRHPAQACRRQAALQSGRG